MNGAGMPSRPRFDRLSRYAPLPLVAVTVLLVILILITPVLISSGQPGPSLLTQAELVVDRLPGNTTIHFYVHGLGATVRYSSIRIGLSSGAFNWTPSKPVVWRSIDWSIWENHSDVVSTSIESIENPIALNITAFYASSSGNAWYGGIVAFYVASSPSGDVLYGASAMSAVVVPASVPVDNSSLPYPVTLTTVAPGGP